MYRVLLVEDDEDLSTIVSAHFSGGGYLVDQAFTCAQALARLGQAVYDLILLDVLLPDQSGEELCRTIRRGCDCPIIFMSCLGDSGTIIRALRGGGDDYVVKPVRYGELMARAAAVLRRTRRSTAEPPVRVFRGFEIDTLRHRIRRGGKEVDLSATEYALLRYMAERPDTLLLYQDLYRGVWNSDSLGDFRTVMVHVSNLRKKIDPGRRGIIETVRGAGYIFSDK